MTRLSSARRWTDLKGLWWGGVVCVMATTACAHSAQVTSPPGEASPKVGRTASAGAVTFTNAEIGVSIEVPKNLSFGAGDNLGTLARGADSSELRVFIEHMPRDTNERGCWERLYKRIPGALLDSPANVDELIALATAGIRRGDRFVYLSVHPKGTRCYVLVGEGPKESQLLPEAVPVARKSFTIGEPSPAMAAEFEIDAGMQLLDEKEFPSALDRFERALVAAPQSHRAHFGAGLAAYFAGPTYAERAIEHLAVVTSVGSDDESAPQLRSEQVRDALMYLGLSYAAKKEFLRAMSTLAELVARHPGDATGRYNLACVLALSGDADGALVELREALQMEPSLIGHAQKDEDLVSLRPLPAWNELFNRLESQRSKRAPR